MKKTSKSLSLVLVLAMLVSLLSMVTVSAAASLEIGEVTYTVTDGVATFTVPYTAVDVNQITILATKGDKSGAPTESEANIVYADQQDYTAGSFTFKVKMSHFNAETPYIYIKIGGTAIDSAQKADGVDMVEDVVEILMYGDVNGDDVINVNDAVLMVEYIGTTTSGGELDSTKFPNGDFPNTSQSAKLTDDDVINVNDVVILVEYIGTKASGGVLDEIKFPGGKFPGDKN